MDNPARHRNRGTGKRAGNAALAYALVLTVVGAGLLVTGLNSRYAVRGIALVGCALLVTAAARLIVPERYLGMLANRSKAIDAAAYALLGGGVLGLALAVP